MQRYIRNREISASELAVDPLNSFIRNLVGTEKRIKDDHGLLRTNFTQELSEQFPSARIFCRYRNAFLLDSKCYARGSANSFVEIETTPNTVGQILAFYDNGSVNCLVKVYEVVEVISIDLEGTRFSSYADSFVPMGYAVEETENTIHCAVGKISGKFVHFLFDQLYVIKILKHFEHD